MVGMVISRDRSLAVRRFTRRAKVHSLAGEDGSFTERGWQAAGARAACEGREDGGPHGNEGRESEAPCVNEAQHGRELKRVEMMARRVASSRPSQAKLRSCVSERTNLAPIVRTCAPSCGLRFAPVVPLSERACAERRETDLKTPKKVSGVRTAYSLGSQCFKLGKV